MVEADEVVFKVKIQMAKLYVGVLEICRIEEGIPILGKYIFY